LTEPNFLITEDIIQIHGIQLQQFGSPPSGIRDFNVIDSARASAEWLYCYRADDFSSQNELLIHISAKYLFQLATSQGFVDGNKRTALASAVHFLKMNDIDFPEMSDEEQLRVEQFVCEVGANQHAEDEVVEFLIWCLSHGKS